jgi:hypothetical protein
MNERTPLDAPLPNGHRHQPLQTGPRPLHRISDEIVSRWRDPYFGAVPYIRAMRYLATMTDKYGDDDADDIVMYFLSNAKTWRGDDARRIKAELNAMLSEHRAATR